jgi:hypothetical protein
MGINRSTDQPINRSTHNSPFRVFFRAFALAFVLVVAKPRWGFQRSGISSAVICLFPFAGGPIKLIWWQQDDQFDGADSFCCLVPSG